MKKFVFDGQVYAQRMSGQYRYADEILKELDKIALKDQYEIVVPQYVNINEKFKNIKVIQWGNVRGILWTQTSLLWYLLKNNAVSISFCNITPLLKPGISVVHDVGYKVLKNHYKNLYGRMSSLWHRLNYWVIAKGKQPIITVSEFSKNQIIDIYRVNPNRITVLGNGWQHYNQIIEDQSIFEEYPNIFKGNYYFGLGSLEERKNFKWISEVARRNKNRTFVIAGGNVKNNKEKLDMNKDSNIIYTGYITDSKAKCLMKNCKAFLFPSTFEGFGIPPLEALSIGTEVICSDAASLPEICDDAVTYIKPNNYDIDFENIEKKAKDIKERVLQKYSWERSAKGFIIILQNKGAEGYKGEDKESV